MKFFAKGKRGYLYTDTRNGKKVVVKRKNPTSKAVGRIVNEIRILNIVNKHNIGPKLLDAGDDYFVMEFVEGIVIGEFLESASRVQILKIVTDLFEQMYLLDKLKINKEEMHHPFKHVIVGNKPVLIDFERCRYTQKPKNVTQFCTYMISNRVVKACKEKNIVIDREQIIALQKAYKKDMGRKSLDAIINSIAKAT